MSQDPLNPMPAATAEPTRQQINRWRKHLADERAEGAVYRELARKKSGEEREILMGIADAESRHEEYWRARLGEHVGLPRQASLSTRLMAWMAKRFGSVFVLALLQSAETRNNYIKDADASEQMIADEAIHAEVVRGLAARGRAKMSGDFRAAIFGANDGLVSNLALVLGMVGTGASARVVLMTGITGLLAGALSMAAGEYVSVSSQQELLDANRPDPNTQASVPKLDMEENELELVYRARGMSVEDARAKAQDVFEHIRGGVNDWNGSGFDRTAAEDIEEPGGSGMSAAISSFFCFGVGAVIPVLPYVFGASGMTAALIAAVLVGIALLMTGAIVGLLSGMAPGMRALRQLLIGFGAAGITFLLGMLFGVSTG